MRIAIIPARGGSKRIPRKNIKKFAGRPMIAWSISATLNASIFDQIIVSTDDPEIAETASLWGAEVPFVRPKNLSNDFSDTTSVVVHAINWCKEAGMVPAEICCVYATAPFISSDDIRTGLRSLRENEGCFVVSVSSYAAPVQRALKISKTGRAEMFNPDLFSSRSQDLECAYHDAGQFYWGSYDTWLSGRPLLGSHTVPVVLPRFRVQDIDTDEDWKRAELMAAKMTF
ncbi:MAG: pseudaminic acid cytidylyltransferase [Flavobacteriaceae bacterium]|nr:pseudaminic acid cytidylyltransferase [Flavobacteriaceae bacterium]|tara:strand:- start:583 stop:1269 length:687 start_codon:yes stop_codon:yes gene_type:complete